MFKLLLKDGETNALVLETVTSATHSPEANAIVFVDAKEGYNDIVVFPIDNFKHDETVHKMFDEGKVDLSFYGFLYAEDAVDAIDEIVEDGFKGSDDIIKELERRQDEKEEGSDDESDSDG